MGCCCSRCKEDKGSVSGEPSERTHLLQDPVSNSTTAQRIPAEDFPSPLNNSLSKNSDELSALNKILQDTAANVIDVSALRAHSMEQHEYIDRKSQYQMKLSGVGGSWWRLHAARSLLVDCPLPEQVLAAAPVLPDDLMFVKTFGSAASSAFANFQVTHREDLVVPFSIP